MFRSMTPPSAAPHTSPSRAFRSWHVFLKSPLGLRVSRSAGGDPLAKLLLATVRITILFLAIVGVASSVNLIPSGSLVYVDDSNEWMAHVRAEILKQKLPIRITIDPEQADYLIRGGFDGTSAALELITSDGVVVWADRTRFGFFKINVSASRNLVKKLKKAIRGR